MNAPKRMDTMQRQRLESLDVLRGFDLFCLVGLEAVMHALDGAVDAPWFDRVMWCFTHVDWEGFSSWDLVMPLFMFMSGVTIPFALARYKREGNKGVPTTADACHQEAVDQLHGAREQWLLLPAHGALLLAYRL